MSTWNSPEWVNLAKRVAEALNDADLLRDLGDWIAGPDEVYCNDAARRLGEKHGMYVWYDGTVWFVCGTRSDEADHTSYTSAMIAMAGLAVLAKLPSNDAGGRGS